MMHADIVVDRIHIRLSGIHDIVDLPVVHQPHDLVALRKAVHRPDIYSERAYGFCGARRRVDIQPEIAELFRKPQYLEFILIVDGKVDADLPLFARMAEFEPGRNQSLKERFFDRLADAEHFAGRLHFRPELRIYVIELFIREYGDFDGDVRRTLIQPRAVSEFLQLRSHDDLRRELHHRHARDLRDIRNGTRSARVDLDDIQFVMEHEELYIDQALRFQRKSSDCTADTRRWNPRCVRPRVRYAA